MESSPEPALIVFAWGNESRGDDAIGPTLARRLENLNRPELVVIEDHQLNIEHVTDFSGSTPLLFIDASIAINAGFQISQIGPSEDGNFSTHAISPQALLNVYRDSIGEPLPDAYLLEVAGTRFGLGERLGSTASDALDAAWLFLESLLDLPASRWGSTLSAIARG